MRRKNILYGCPSKLDNCFHFFQTKIHEAEANRHQYEENRDSLKATIHGLNSVDLKVKRNIYSQQYWQVAVQNPSYDF